MSILQQFVQNLRNILSWRPSDAGSVPRTVPENILRCRGVRITVLRETCILATTRGKFQLGNLPQTIERLYRFTAVIHEELQYDVDPRQDAKKDCEAMVASSTSVQRVVVRRARKVFAVR